MDFDILYQVKNCSNQARCTIHGSVIYKFTQNSVALLTGSGKLVSSGFGRWRVLEPDLARPDFLIQKRIQQERRESLPLGRPLPAGH